MQSSRIMTQANQVRRTPPDLDLHFEFGKYPLLFSFPSPSACCPPNMRIIQSHTRSISLIKCLPGTFSKQLFPLGHVFSLPNPCRSLGLTPSPSWPDTSKQGCTSSPLSQGSIRHSMGSWKEIRSYAKKSEKPSPALKHPASLSVPHCDSHCSSSLSTSFCCHACSISKRSSLQTVVKSLVESFEQLKSWASKQWLFTVKQMQMHCMFKW